MEPSPEEITQHLNRWMECYQMALKVNDIENQIKYNHKLMIVWTWFLQNGFVEE